MLRRVRQIRNVRQMMLSTTPPGEKFKKSIFSTFSIGRVVAAVAVVNVGLLYLSYKAETDPKFDDQLKTVPSVHPFINPIRGMLKEWKLVELRKELEEKINESTHSISVHEKKHPHNEEIVEQENSVVDDINLVAEITEEPFETNNVPVEPPKDLDVSETLPIQEIDHPQQAIAELDLTKSIIEEKNEESVPEADTVQTVDISNINHSSTPMQHNSSIEGHARFLDVPSEQIIRSTESTVLKQAMADSARELLALRRELEMTLLKDIHTLNENDLRIRIKQLAAELFQRLAWEDLRMTQSLKGVQSELTDKYLHLMQQQREEMQIEVAKTLLEAERDAFNREVAKVDEIERKYQKQLTETVKAQAEGFNTTLKIELEKQATQIQSELQDQMNHSLAVVRKSQVDHLMEMEPIIASLGNDVTQLKAGVVDTAAHVVKQSSDAHALSAAVLALEMALTTADDNSSASNNNITEQCKKLSALSSSTSVDEVVRTVVSSLPTSLVQQGRAPPSLAQLQVRFAVMREEVRKAALAPEAAPKMVGQLIGTVLASISWAPTGLVRGPGTEEALARAAYYLDRGQLIEALKEVKAVEGYSQVLMQDWKKLAEDRLMVDQAIRVLKANSILRHKSFVR